MASPSERLRVLAKRTLGWWLLPIVIVMFLAGLALLGDKAPVRFFVYSVL